MLRFILDESKRCHSLENAVKNVVTSYDGQRLYRADSWKGKAIQWMRGYETAENREKRVCQLLWKALQIDDSSIPFQEKIRLSNYLRQKLVIISRPEALHERFDSLQKHLQAQEKPNPLLHCEETATLLSLEAAQSQFQAKTPCPKKQTELAKAKKNSAAFK